MPLCSRAQEILEKARTLEDGAARLIFTREAESRSAPVGCANCCAGRDRSRAARVPVEFPGLGRRGDGSSARGGRGGAGACGEEQGRGGVPAHGDIANVK